MTSPDLVIATMRASLSDTSGRLLRLVRWLKLAGVSIELLVLDHAPDLDTFAAEVPTTVLVTLPGPIAATLAAVGGGRVNQVIRSRALKRWMAARPDAAVLVNDPQAASVIRHSAQPRRFVATLTPNQRVDDVLEVDRATLAQATGWLVNDADQVADVDAAFGRPAVEQGALPFPDDLPETTSDEANGAVVLLPTPGRWLAINHTIEVARAVHSLHPEREIRWLVSADDDRWMDDHDVRHAGLTDSVRFVSETAPDVLRDVAIIVRTGYGPSPTPLLTSARLAGVPIVGFSTQDVSPPLDATEPFDVEGLSDLLASALAPDGIEALQVVPGAGVHPNPRDLIDQLVRWLDLPAPTQGQAR